MIFNHYYSDLLNFRLFTKVILELGIKVLSYKNAWHYFVTEGFQEIVPGILPFFHIYGLTVILFHSFVHGSKVVTMPKFEPILFSNILKREKVSNKIDFI